MKAKFTLIIPAISGLIAALTGFAPLYSIIVQNKSEFNFQLREPGQDNLPPEGRKSYSNVKIGEFFEAFEAVAPTGLSGVWAGFRGNNANNVSPETLALVDRFEPEKPPVMWRKELGEGHGAPAIYKGYAYILDYIEDKQSDALRCFSLLTGEELWRRYYRLEIKRNHGYSRTVPAVNETSAVTMGPLCHLMCVDRMSGDLRWSLDIVGHFNSQVPQWYSGQCPLIYDNELVIAPAGEKALLAGFDVDTGEILWQTPNPRGWKMSHSSVTPMVHAGKKMFVYAAVGGVIGVSAEAGEKGRILWETGDWGATVIAPSPVIIDGGYVYQSAGYGAGSILIKVEEKNGDFSAVITHKFNPKEAMATEQQSAIFYRQTLFGIMTKDAGARRMRLAASNPTNPSEFFSEGDPQLRFGLGPVVVADDKLFALADNGTLSIMKFENNRFIETTSSRILPGVDAWGPLAIAEGIMLARDSTSMVCLDLTRDSRWIKRIAADGK